MPRQMCATCPFRPKSPFFGRRDDWGANLDNEMFAEAHPNDGSIAHICHEIDMDKGGTTDKNLQCIGHIDWMQGVKR